MLLGFLAVTSLAVIMLRDLFGVVMLSGIYSLISASAFLLMDAPDVAFTEAAVGAGIAPLLMLATLALTGRWEKPGRRPAWPGIIIVVATGALLIWGLEDLPDFGDPQAPAHQHVAPRYIEESPGEIGIPNMVTSVLASYRGFDTLGEVAVVFAAGLGVLLLIGGRRKRREQD